MKPQFQNLSFECWEHPGKLGLATPALCLNGGPDAAAVLLAAVGELESDGPPARRTLTLRPHGRPDPVLTIRIVLSPESDDLRQMSITRVGKTAILEFAPQGFEELRQALLRWQAGGEDFGLSPDGSRKARHLKKTQSMGAKDLASGELWFWGPRLLP